MPFFALVMIESRLIRMLDELTAEIGADELADLNAEDRMTLIQDRGQGYNKFIFEKNQTLKDICQKVRRLTQTFGQDWNDALYALAKIESRFRIDSRIDHGNTLTDDKFYNNDFDVVIANPPYGVSWNGYEKDVRNDKTQRFQYLPSISDGQLLFMQHLISKQSVNGMGVVVHNGSTLFSGDAGSAESNIRKWMLDIDIVEGRSSCRRMSFLIRVFILIYGC